MGNLIQILLGININGTGLKKKYNFEFNLLLKVNSSDPMSRSHHHHHFSLTGWKRLERKKSFLNCPIGESKLERAVQANYNINTSLRRCATRPLDRQPKVLSQGLKTKDYKADIT